MKDVFLCDMLYCGHSLYFLPTSLSVCLFVRLFVFFIIQFLHSDHGKFVLKSGRYLDKYYLISYSNCVHVIYTMDGI